MTRPGLAIDFDLRDVVRVEAGEERVIVTGDPDGYASLQVYVVADDDEVLAVSMPGLMDLIARPSHTVGDELHGPAFEATEASEIEVLRERCRVVPWELPTVAYRQAIMDILYEGVPDVVLTPSPIAPLPAANPTLMGPR